jgi:hypothetical protein
MKQIAVYADIEECKYTALFKWTYLILINFYQLEGSALCSAREEAHAIWINEDKKPSCLDKFGQDVRFVKHCPIRLALFGWLLQAFTGALPSA